MASRRTQPYRATGARHQTTALRAMQKGRGPLRYMAPGEVRRRAMRKRKTRRRGRARYSTPTAKALAVRRRVGGS